MLISGIQKFSLLDWPGRPGCIIFTPGCDFRCGYCHNPEFVLPELIAKVKNNFIPEESFFNFLKQRIGLLEGVVITGGEPTLMTDLLPFIRKIKALGFLVKLDTNGNRPEALKEAFDEHLLDYVALDIKTSAAEYQNLAGRAAAEEKIRRSIDLIKNSGTDYEFRSTLVKELHSPAVLEAMRELVAGAKKLYLQKFCPEQTLAPEFARYHSFSDLEMEEIAGNFRDIIGQAMVR